MLQKVEQRFLHHVRHFVSFQRRPDQHDGSHRRHDVVRRRGLLFLEENLAFVLGRRGGQRGPGRYATTAGGIIVFGCSTDKNAPGK